MQKFQRRFWAVVLVVGMAFLWIGCGGDDDDDDDDSSDAGTICDRVASCGLGGDLGISNMDECVAAVDAMPAETRECIVAATGCDAVEDCLGLGDDDSDDDTSDDDSDDDTGEPPPDTFSCADEGLTVRDWIDAAADDALYAMAADFTVPTTKGDWNFAEHFTGCETYLFIQSNPRQNAGFDTPLWDRDAKALLQRAPGNVHFFFVSTKSEQADRDAEFAALTDQIDTYLDTLSQDEQDRWWHRLHYITQIASVDLESYLGDLMKSPRWGFGIDRLQRIRYIGSYADYSRYDSGQGWFAPNLSMASNEAIYYNFESDREDMMDAEDATVITIFDGTEISDPGWTGARTTADITLPDAVAMAGYDSAELDLYLGCVGDGEFGTCPAWDYINSLYLCDAGDPDTCDVEFGRWITTYHREGRWVHDVSGLLPLIEDGGLRRFAFYSQQPYEVYLTLRLVNKAKPVKPYDSEYVFSGGAFDLTFNDDYSPTDIAIPADATKIELATVISGHGQVSPGTCAEFCDTQLLFYVNGAEHEFINPIAGTSTGCMDQVDEGAVPNQYGTWWYGRNGWCPGKEVQMVMTDITADVTPGDNATFDLEGYYDGEPYPTDGANIDMTSWVVFSK